MFFLIKEEYINFIEENLAPTRLLACGMFKVSALLQVFKGDKPRDIHCTQNRTTARKHTDPNPNPNT